MVIPRKWKVVSGGVVAAVTVGGGAAVAEQGTSVPELRDVRHDFSKVEFEQSVGSDDLIQLQQLSPFSEVSAQSVSEPSVQSVSVESVTEPSEPSVAVESVTEPSEPSVSEQSVSEPSEPSVESVSVPSAESDD